MPSRPLCAPRRASTSAVSICPATLAWLHSKTIRPSRTVPSAAAANNRTARSAQGGSSSLFARNVITGTVPPSAPPTARQSTSRDVRPSSDSAASARSLRTIQWHIATTPFASSPAIVAACHISESWKGVRRKISCSRIFGSAPNAALGTFNSRRKNRSRDTSGSTIACCRVTPCSASHFSSAAAPKCCSGIRVSTGPVGDAIRHATQSPSRQTVTVGVPSPSAHSSQCGGTAPRNPDSHHCAKVLPHAVRTWKPPARATDTSATGMTAPCGSRHSIRVDEAYLLILYEE